MTRFKLLTLLLLCTLVPGVFGQISLPALVSNGMVLQRGKASSIWGTASPGEQITVTFCNSSYETKADQEGRWKIDLNIPEAGGPFTMILKGKNEIILDDILIGEVWVCSGQSNMQLTMARTAPLYTKVIAESENPRIRQFIVPNTYNFHGPQDDLDGGKWLHANPENVPDFSALAYFFSREIEEHYQVPVGILNSSLGGSPAEAWMSEDCLKQFPEHYKELQKFKSDSLIRAIESADKKKTRAWYHEALEKDKGQSEDVPWFAEKVNDKDWRTVSVPGYWSDSYPEEKNGIFWYRKEFSVPAKLSDKEALLLLGRIIDSDSTYINGVFVGTTSYKHPPRRYKIPEGLLHPGHNTIAIKVFSISGQGGFVPDKDYRIELGDEKIELAGDWKFSTGSGMKALGSTTRVRWKPGGLYNAMIAPLMNYTVRGVVWYQGEANAKSYNEYRELFPALIRCWRAGWSMPELPFLFVQLPNYMEAVPEPQYAEWAFMREAQTEALKLPKTAMAVTIDLGEWNDIHPINKKDVAYRIALHARQMVYGEKNLVTEGPEYSSFELKGDTAVIYFNRLGGGLITSDNMDPRGFTLAGKDGQFHHASARLEGEEVLVWCTEVDQPVALRYAWENNPVGLNLYNKEGLPLAPFRTDKLGQ